MIEEEKGTGRNGWFLAVAASVSSLGGFLFGYDNIVISGTIGYLAKAFNFDHLSTPYLFSIESKRNRVPRMLAIMTAIVLAGYFANAAEPAKVDPAEEKYKATLKAVHDAGKVKYPDQKFPPPKPEAVEAWRDLRFGMFITWGTSSLTGRELSWSRGSPTSIEEYDNLYKRFNPEKFNADEWLSIAKASGMKYIVFTAKHHDGFCLWDTQYTDYNIMKSPFKRDIVGELSRACKKQGIQLGIYYSQVDWHHPDFPFTGYRGRTVREKYDMDVYEQYALNQTKELIEKYGPLLTIWNDICVYGYQNRGVPIIRMIRALQPNILINGRTGSGGDYGTPEQTIGAFKVAPWESCMTVSKRGQWGWGGEKDGVKDLKTCLTFLISAAGGNGNMLLNVGPTPEGEIAAVQRKVILEMVQWTQRYGESIYATRRGPYKPTSDLACTYKGNTVYLHVLRWTGGTLTLPPLPMRILKSELLTGGKVELRQSDQGVTIAVAKEFQQPIDTIVKFELDGPAKEIKPIEVAQPEVRKPNVIVPTKVKAGEAINIGDVMESENTNNSK